jgi:hypothetical protein
MEIEELKSIINSGDEEYIKHAIIVYLAKDEGAILLMMKILEQERQFKKEVSQEMNVLLSKADIGLDDNKFNENGFIQKEILAFYTKYKGVVGHCFKNLFKNEN